MYDQFKVASDNNNLDKKNNNGEATFNADIDNYIGVKMIRNYMIASINEEDYNGKLYSIGVISLFNKDKKITREDIDRIRSIQKFLGAAATRVSVMTSSLTVLIGLSMLMDSTKNNLCTYEQQFTANLAESVQHLQPLDKMKKHLNMVWDTMSPFIEQAFPPKPQPPS